MSQLLKRWEPSTFYLLGQEIRLEVRAPHFSEEAEFNRRMMTVGLKARPAQEALRALQAGEEIAPEALDALFASVDPKWAAGIFARYVRLPEPVTFDGEEPITTGAALFDAANGALVQAVLQKVEGRRLPPLQQLHRALLDEGERDLVVPRGAVGAPAAQRDADLAAAVHERAVRNPLRAPQREDRPRRLVELEQYVERPERLE